jgi:transposase
MARPYSLDLRERVVRAVLSGQPCRAVADVFGVSVASVVKWSQRHRATGSAAAKPMGSRRPFVLEAERGWLLSRIREEPEITTRALARELAARGIVVGHVAVWNILRRERQTFKKNRLRQRAGSP